MAEDSKLHIDSDWKAQAQAEKKKLREAEEKAREAGAGQAGGPGEMPPANFDTLLQTFVTNALLAMGAVPDPETGQRYAHLGLARHHIDMLGVIEEKTKGNLSEEEEEALTNTLHELRQAFVQIAEQARAAAAQGGGQGGTPGAGPSPSGPAPGPAGGSGAGPGGIVTP